MWKKYTAPLIIESVLIFIIALIILGYSVIESLRFTLLVLIITLVIRGLMKVLKRYSHVFN